MYVFYSSKGEIVYKAHTNYKPKSPRRSFKKKFRKTTQGESLTLFDSLKKRKQNTRVEVDRVHL